MSDIVERLRDYATVSDVLALPKLCGEAAVEITRLREALATSRELREFDADEIQRLRQLLATRRPAVTE